MEKYIKWIIILILIFQYFIIENLYAKGQGQTYTNKNYNIRVYKPKKWIVFDKTNNIKIYKMLRSAMECDLICAFSHNSDSSPPSILITRDLLSKKYINMTLKELNEITKEGIKRNFSKSEIVELPHLVTINGKKFSKYTTIQKEDNESGTCVTYDYKSNGIVYTIQCVSKTGEFKKYKELFEKILKSFSLKK